MLVLPPERSVDCHCDPTLTVAVLAQQSVNACLCCGKVEFTEALVDE